MIRYISTRGDNTPKSFTDVLLNGMAPDGGLYVPHQWPHIRVDDLVGLSYPQMAYKIIHPFVGGDIPDDDLKEMIDQTYGDNFKHAAVAPLVQMAPSLWSLELFCGPTLAFKDYALQLVGRLFDYVLKQRGERLTIVGATSGDTGSAAIEACRNCSNLDIFILHPNGRTSEAQRRQMTTVVSSNVFNIALEGHFDDCQNAVKAMFADENFRNDIHLSAVNSINWARIMAQIVYYFAAAVALNRHHDKIAFAVPTGNFGNVYAGYCAMKMGLPVERLIIGSNRNDILTRFFETGSMTAGSVEPSLSPSMDIQVSSNFERLLFDIVDRDSESVVACMGQFKNAGEYTLTKTHWDRARDIFCAHRCSDEQTLATMRQWYDASGYVLDPHTAVGVYAAQKTALDTKIPVVALACAHPAKFPDSVQKATGVRPPLPSHLADLYDRKEVFTVLPNDLDGLKKFIREKRNK